MPKKDNKENLDLKKFCEKNLQKNDTFLSLFFLNTGFFHLKAFGREFKILLHFFSLLSYQNIIKKETYIKCITTLSIFELFLRIIKEKIGQLSTTYSNFIKKIISKVNKKTFAENIKDILLFKTDLKDLDETVFKEINEFIQRTLKNQFISFGEKKYKDCNDLAELLKNSLLTKTPINFSNLNESILGFFLAISENNEFKKTKFNLEHIRSKSFDKKKTISKETAEIGNLIFLEEEINESIGNLSFDEKIKQYRKSKNIDVQNLVKNSDKKQTWDSDSIDERTNKKLSDFIEKIKEFLENI